MVTVTGLLGDFFELFDESSDPPRFEDIAYTDGTPEDGEVFASLLDHRGPGGTVLVDRSLPTDLAHPLVSNFLVREVPEPSISALLLLTALSILRRRFH